MVFEKWRLNELVPKNLWICEDFTEKTSPYVALKYDYSSNQIMKRLINVVAISRLCANAMLPYENAIIAVKQAVTLIHV